jgi:hypothetical protein
MPTSGEFRIALLFALASISMGGSEHVIDSVAWKSELLDSKARFLHYDEVFMNT